jgi:hypothetical protein
LVLVGMLADCVARSPTALVSAVVGLGRAASDVSRPLMSKTARAGARGHLLLAAPLLVVEPDRVRQCYFNHLREWGEE